MIAKEPFQKIFGLPAPHRDRHFGQALLQSHEVGKLGDESAVGSPVVWCDEKTVYVAQPAKCALGQVFAAPPSIFVTAVPRLASCPFLDSGFYCCGIESLRRI